MEDLQDFKTWCLKILLPALVAISIKLAIQSKSMRMTWFSAISSFVVGVGFAYLFSDIVLSKVAKEYTSAIIAVIAISGERIGYWIIYKFNIEAILEGWVKSKRV
jgi:hypothetical protein